MIRERATCALAAGSIQGGTILRVEPIRPISHGELDSLRAAASEAERASAADWTRAVESDADSLWLRSRALARRAALYRNAVAAAARSAGAAGLPRSADSATAAGPAGPLRTCRVRVRIRWGGPLVGPEPVDREHVLRALAAPGGRWIVFSIFQREDDPSPEPI